MIEKGDEVNMVCPNCSADTKLEVKKNRKSGELFLGCPNWPNCSHTQPIPEHIKMEEAGQPKLFDV